MNKSEQSIRLALGENKAERAQALKTLSVTLGYGSISEFLRQVADNAIQNMPRTVEEMNGAMHTIYNEQYEARELKSYSIIKGIAEQLEIAPNDLIKFLESDTGCDDVVDSLRYEPFILAKRFGDATAAAEEEIEDALILREASESPSLDG